MFPGTIASKIGSKVRRWRIEDNLTEDAVAGALGCSVDYLRAAERGQINFSAKNIYDLCSILRMVPSWFFEEMDDPS